MTQIEGNGERRRIIPSQSILRLRDKFLASNVKFHLVSSPFTQFINKKQFTFNVPSIALSQFDSTANSSSSPTLNKPHTAGSNDNNREKDATTDYFDYDQPFHYDYDNYTPVRRFFQTVGHLFFGYLCKAYMHAFHKITFVNNKEFEDLVWNQYVNRKRATNSGKPVRGLLTVLNHASMMDEPFLVANLIPSKWFRTPDIIRSPICAKDQCFTNVFLAEMAKTLKILPMERGGSIHQKPMQIIIDKLSSGSWVSIFPEGYIAQDGEIHKVRRGVGKLILESEPTPHVYPIYHRGMEGVKSEKKMLPSLGSHIVVKLGKEIHFEDIISEYKKGNVSADQAYIQIAARIEEKMKELKLQVDEYRRIHNIRNKAEDEV